MPTMRRSRLFSLLALGGVAAACESTSAPNLGSVFDTDAAAADYATFDSMFGSEGWAGFQALGTRTPWGESPAAVGAVASLAGAGNGRQFALQLARRLTAATSAAPARAPVIDTYRGNTFVYDPELDEYVVDPERTGAPVTGVRFVLYEVDHAGRPIAGEEIGHADLIDEGDDSDEDVALRLVVVAEDVTVLDYRTTVDLTLTQGSITVDGFLQGPTGPRLDFEIQAVGTRFLDRSTLDVQFDLRVDARDFSIVGSVQGVNESVANGAEGHGDVDLIVQHGDDSIRLDVSGSEGEIDGSVYVNGSLFARVTGDAENPTILSGTGEPLTPGQLFVLHHIVDVVEDVFDFLEDLVDPVDEIVFLGLIL